MILKRNWEGSKFLRISKKITLGNFSWSDLIHKRIDKQESLKLQKKKKKKYKKKFIKKKKLRLGTLMMGF